MPSSNREGASAPSEAGELIDGPNKQDCSKHPGGWGVPMSDYEYIWYGNKSEGDYPKEACVPYYHQYAQIDSLLVNQSILGAATAIDVPAAIITCTEVNASGTVAANAFTGPTISSLQSGIAAAQSTASSKKGFDIPHPTKQDNRLRYICVEGPTADVYTRGRLTGKNVIELPEYWRGLVDLETITVTLTQIKTSQDLIIEGIEWGTIIKIRSGNGTDIDCFYHVQAERIDVEKNIPEYEGLTTADYPGDNGEYRLNNN